MNKQKNSFITDYLQQSLRSCQLKQLSILEEVDRICKKYDLDYWIDGGTLLGAVRHGGFIPWDDDIDLVMPQKDAIRFLEVAQKELPATLFLQTRETDPENHKPIMKIRDLNSLYIESNDDFSSNYQKGIFVDIFPFVDYPSVSRAWVKKIMKGISVSYSILHTKHYYSLRSFAEFFYFGMKYGVFRFLWAITTRLCPKGKFLSYTIHNNGYGIMYEKDIIYPLQEIEFEGKRFKAPHNLDAYLRVLYNNYMEIPPVEKRIIHALYIHPELVKP